MKARTRVKMGGAITAGQEHKRKVRKNSPAVVGGQNPLANQRNQRRRRRQINHGSISLEANLLGLAHSKLEDGAV